MLDVLEAGLAAPDPYENVKKIVRIEDGRLLVGHPDFSEPPGQPELAFDLATIGNIYVVGGGKVAQRQAEALEEILGDRITGGQINAKKGDSVRLKRIPVTLAGHPIPDADSIAGAAAHRGDRASCEAGRYRLPVPFRRGYGIDGIARARHQPG